MQVNYVGEHVTHAVISKGVARDFGISQSAEFFNILSNTLYSDKILAVVREVLCNAWDIHIQTGRTDKPVDITLANGKLTIRDYGTGISDDDIHPIYAVYGNSTKKLDGTQTGGFGLGSKSPFAYVDHFDVASFFAGRKTIYAVSKSSAEVAGKPSIMPLVTVPCGDETGLEVSIAIQDQDIIRFKQVIHMIARFGEMNIMFNGNRLPTIAFSQAKHGFVMVKDMTEVSGAQNNRIFLRYGNVVYPIPTHSKLGHEYDKVIKLLQRVGGNDHYSGNTYWKIIFQARPNTISVTPSRESLSMTDHTVESIRALFNTFLAMTEAQLQTACLEIERECVERVWKDGRLVDLLDSNNKVPTLFDRDAVGYGSRQRDIIKEPEVITDVSAIGRSYMSRAYPNFAGFRQADMMMRLDVLERSVFGGAKNRGKIQSFRKQYNAMGIAKVESQAWFQRTIVQPLIRKLDAVPELSGSKLLIYGDHSDSSIDKNGRRRSWSDGKKFVEAAKISGRPLEGYLPFLRNIVVISFNRIDVEERLPKFPIMDTNLGVSHDLFVYVVSRMDKKIDIVREFFTAQGMVIVDLTVRQDWEPKHVLEPITKPVVVKPRKKGLPKLSALLVKDHRGHDSLKYERYQPTKDLEIIERTEAPQFIVQFNPRAQSANMISGLDLSYQMAIVRLYGDLGGVVVNDNQRSRFVNELKIPELQTWLLAKLKEEVLTNPRMQLGFAFEPDKLLNDFARRDIRSSYDKQVILKMILRNPELAIEFGVLNEMTAEDRMMFYLVNGFVKAHYHWNYDKEVLEMRKHIDQVKPTQEIEELALRIANSNLTKLLNAEVFSAIFKDTGIPITKTQKAQRSGALDVLQYVLS